MKRKIYILISVLSLGALIGTAGASDLDTLPQSTIFHATLVWTSLFIGFGVLALKSKKKVPCEAATSTEDTKNNSTFILTGKEEKVNDRALRFSRGIKSS